MLFAALDASVGGEVVEGDAIGCGPLQYREGQDHRVAVAAAATTVWAAAVVIDAILSRPYRQVVGSRRGHGGVGCDPHRGGVKEPPRVGAVWGSSLSAVAVRAAALE